MVYKKLKVSDYTGVKRRISQFKSTISSLYKDCYKHRIISIKNYRNLIKENFLYLKLYLKATQIKWRSCDMQILRVYCGILSISIRYVESA